MPDMMQGFFKEVGRHSLLTREDEVALAQQMESKDESVRNIARNRMVKSNIRLAISIAKRYQNRGCDFEDLIQESTLGLMKAVDRFDWRRGFKFSTYATWWIRQSVMRHITLQSSSIRLPAGANSLVWRARRAAEEYQKEFGVQPSVEELADSLGVGQSSLDILLQTSKYTLSIDAHGQGDNSPGLLLERKKSSGFALVSLRAQPITLIFRSLKQKLQPSMLQRIPNEYA